MLNAFAATIARQPAPTSEEVARYSAVLSTGDAALFIIEHDIDAEDPITWGAWPTDNIRQQWQDGEVYILHMYVLSDGEWDHQDALGSMYGDPADLVDDYLTDYLN